MNEYIDKRFNAIELKLPKQISLILSKFYPELLEKKVPKRMFKLPKEFIVSFIRAFADDESCVTTSAILYTQKDKEVLEDLRKLHLLVGFKERNLTAVKKKGNVYNFSIIGTGLIHYNNNVGYKNPDKRNYLEVEVKRKNTKRTISTVDTTKKEITTFLGTPKTVRELSALIGIQPSRIRKHMDRLEKDGFIKIIAYKKYKVPLWAKIKNYELIDDERKIKILTLLKHNNCSTLEISRKLNLSKDRVMTYLYELRNSSKINYKVKGRIYIWCYNEN